MTSPRLLLFDPCWLAGPGISIVLPSETKYSCVSQQYFISKIYIYIFHSVKQSNRGLLFIRAGLIIVLLVISNFSFSQSTDSVNVYSDIITLKRLNDSVFKKYADTVFKMVKSDLSSSLPSMLRQKGKQDSVLKGKVNSVITGSFKSVKESFEMPRISLPHIPLRPLIAIKGGNVFYNTNYRSFIDTPFNEHNIMQHSLYGNFNVTIANIPLRVNYLIRRSNSAFFRNINDIQVEYEPFTFQRIAGNGLKDRLLSHLPNLEDSLLALDYNLNVDKLKGLSTWFSSAGLSQKLIEYKEILSVPGLTFDGNLSDSANLMHSEKLKREAGEFIEQYEKFKRNLDSLKQRTDSLETLYNKMNANVAKYKSIINNISNGQIPYDKIWDELKTYGIKKNVIPRKYIMLLNIRKLGIGRNQLNYSELTSKNMSLTGVNFEYNSWYYAAVAAGTVDYRFRDFVINNNNRKPQYMYMGRLGIGTVESNHLIFSMYKGQKQLFAASSNAASLQSISVTGLAVEGKLRLNKYAYILAEAAQSISPDFRNTPATKTRFTLDDVSNKALFTKFYSYIYKTGSHFEATYKFTGANFQSFSSFQTNSVYKSWSVKADQLFFKRKLKLAASIRSNEFTNPYIIQQYKSNTVFKSIQATFRTRKFPVITAGYLPVSQITAIDNQFAENIFYSFNAGLFHTYRLGIAHATSVFSFNKYYNNESDTSYLYYNANNVYYNQSIVFKMYTLNLSVSHSKSNSFELNVLDAGLEFNMIKWIEIGAGLKINDFDRSISETGWYTNMRFNIKKLGVLSLTYDNGFLPGNNHRFVRNEFLNINFARSF